MKKFKPFIWLTSKNNAMLLNQNIQRTENSAPREYRDNKKSSSKYSKNNCDTVPFFGMKISNAVKRQAHAHDIKINLYSSKKAVMNYAEKEKNDGGKPVRREIFIIIFSRLIVRMIPCKLVRKTLVPIKSLPIFSKFII